MIKRYVFVTLIMTFLVILCSCTLMVGPLDRNSGFSAKLTSIEDNIRNESWVQAKAELKEAKETWKKIKPWVQIDIDHDYVHELEENLAKLEGYIDTEEKPEALATMLLIHETWEDIESI